MNLQLQWRVSPEHVAQLPALNQSPKLTREPLLGDLVKLSDGRNWVVVARTWEQVGELWKLVVNIAPDFGESSPEMHTLH